MFLCEPTQRHQDRFVGDRSNYHLLDDPGRSDGAVDERQFDRRHVIAGVEDDAAEPVPAPQREIDATDSDRPVPEGTGRSCSTVDRDSDSDEFDDRHLGSVAAPRPDLDDPGVAAGTIDIPGSDLVEQLGHRSVVGDRAKHGAPIVE